MNSIEWLARLISFDTTSRNSNLSLISFVQEWLERHQISCRLKHASHDGKANLFATIPAHNGELNVCIILSGHTDVVTVEGKEWHTNPFEAVQVANKIYSRVACDMTADITL